MNYYKATVQYIGTDYFGFQWQKDLPSIQNEINQALYKIVDGKITTLGASRTDTGVHAVEQFVKISSEYSIGCEYLKAQLNSILPADIRCLSVSPCDGSYNPTIDSGSKEYRYLFTNFLQTGCDDQKFIANNPYRLNVELMQYCASLIVGVHDFKNFCSTGSNVKSTIRSIYLAEMMKVDPRQVLPQDFFTLPSDLNECFQFRIIGEGFLKQMVRHLMSALWLVGNGQISPEQFSQLLNGPLKTRRLWKVASSRGLYLYRLN
ncbi:MAG: tRNA pseudouridine(38-40) synthase TruA [Bacteriovoracaceae bacterium]